MCFFISKASIGQDNLEDLIDAWEVRFESVSMGYSIRSFSYSQSKLENKFTPVHSLDFSIGSSNGTEVTLSLGLSSFLNPSPLKTTDRYTSGGYEITERSDKNGLTIFAVNMNTRFLGNVFLDEDLIRIGIEYGSFSPTFKYRRGGFNYFETSEEKVSGQMMGFSTIYEWKYFKFTGSIGQLRGFYNTDFCCTTTNHLYFHIGIGAFLEYKWD